MSIPDEASTYERDRGLAAERTELAWGRSTLALMVCGAAVARGLPNVPGADGNLAAGLVILIVGGFAWIGGLPYARARARSSHTGIRHVATLKELAPLAIGTALVGVAALLIDLVFPG